jgi:hypothetical protein
MCSFIAVQEHWLPPSSLQVFNDIHPDFVGFGISAMKSKLTTCVFRGRPFDGVASLWRKSIKRCAEIASCDDTGRRLGLSLKCNNQKIL